jgi:hypothetical protein
MPRQSQRYYYLAWLRRHVKNKSRELDTLESSDDSSSNSLEREELDLYQHTLSKVEKSRHIFRAPTYCKKPKVFDIEDAISENSTRYNDAEFLADFRLTKQSFKLLLEKLEPMSLFSLSKTKKQASMSLQLLVFLFRAGKSGTAGSSGAVASHFGLSHGCVKNYVRRCVKALLKLKKEVVY